MSLIDEAVEANREYAKAPDPLEGDNVFGYLRRSCTLNVPGPRTPNSDRTSVPATFQVSTACE
jgi:hypothetical protein